MFVILDKLLQQGLYVHVTGDIDILFSGIDFYGMKIEENMSEICEKIEGQPDEKECESLRFGLKGYHDFTIQTYGKKAYTHTKGTDLQPLVLKGFGLLVETLQFGG